MEPEHGNLFSSRHRRGQRNPQPHTYTNAHEIWQNGVARCLYGNKPNGNRHDEIKRLSLRCSFRCSVFRLPFIQLRASFHFSLCFHHSGQFADDLIFLFYLFWFFCSVMPHEFRYILFLNVFFPAACLLPLQFCHAKRKETKLTASANLFVRQKWNHCHVHKNAETTDTQSDTTFTSQGKSLIHTRVPELWNASQKSRTEIRPGASKIPILYK